MRLGKFVLSDSSCLLFDTVLSDMTVDHMLVLEFDELQIGG
jgi:hypothetical protein